MRRYSAYFSRYSREASWRPSGEWVTSRSEGPSPFWPVISSRLSVEPSVVDSSPNGWPLAPVPHVCLGEFDLATFWPPFLLQFPWQLPLHSDSKASWQPRHCPIDFRK